MTDIEVCIASENLTNLPNQIDAVLAGGVVDQHKVQPLVYAVNA